MILTKRKAMSPVIATVILVAMGVFISFYVSNWMMGVTSQYTKFERVEIQGAKCTWDAANDEWLVTLRLKNTGTHTAILTSVSLNDVEVDSYNATTAADGTAATTVMYLAGANPSLWRHVCLLPGGWDFKFPELFIRT